MDKDTDVARLDLYEERTQRTCLGGLLLLLRLLRSFFILTSLVGSGREFK